MSVYFEAVDLEIGCSHVHIRQRPANSDVEVEAREAGESEATA